MSSYLNIYAKPKNYEEKLLLTSYSRNCSLYQAFKDEGVTYIGNEEAKYTKLDSAFLKDTLASVVADRASTERRLNAYKQYLQKDENAINEILSMEEFIEDNKEVEHCIQFLLEIVTDAEMGINSFEGLYANID